MAINHDNIEKIKSACLQYNAKWIAVTKMRSIEDLNELYSANVKIFGENKAQELCTKYDKLPMDIEWHFIGHLQSNKVKSIIDKVSFIHSVDSPKLLITIQKEAARINKIIYVFIQIHIAKEDTKFGFSPKEVIDFFTQFDSTLYPNIKIIGLMAMASMTDNKEQIKEEFESVRTTMNTINSFFHYQLTELSMGMSGDYDIALASGATYIRVGSSLFN